MALSIIFEKSVLLSLINYGVDGLCIYPAELARQVISLRKLYQNQQDCLEDADEEESHKIFEHVVETSHQMLETALLDILKAQGWDLENMKMPKYLENSIKQRIMLKA